MMPTIAELTAELVALVKTAPSIGSKGFSVFDLAELMNTSIGFPSVGVIYEGTDMKQNSVQGQPRNKSAAFFTLHFTVAIGINYRAGSTTDTKPIATDLLDELRQIVLGYSQANNRPWRYSGETPMNTDMEGVIFYGQMWETDILAKGNTAN